jgi:hypothetical protein
VGTQSAVAVLLVAALTGCSISIGGPEVRPPGCATFDRIAVSIEADGPRADVADQLREIEREARGGGEPDVAEAAAELLAAQGGSEAAWYSALGDMQAACFGQR